MTGKIQERLFSETVVDFEKKLTRLYEGECEKLLSSIKEKCEEGNSQGITQTIGRRFGYFWEEMVKDVLSTNSSKATEKV